MVGLDSWTTLARRGEWDCAALSNGSIAGNRLAFVVWKLLVTLVFVVSVLALLFYLVARSRIIDGPGSFPGDETLVISAIQDYRSRHGEFPRVFEDAFPIATNPHIVKVGNSLYRTAHGFDGLLFTYYMGNNGDPVLMFHYDLTDPEDLPYNPTERDSPSVRVERLKWDGS